MWRRILRLFGKQPRDDFDLAPPGLGPEVPHPYEAIPTREGECCLHCGGGRLHEIHKPPFNLRRVEEIERMRTMTDQERIRRDVLERVSGRMAGLD